MSSYCLNRITVDPYRILQVTGDDNKYKLRYDHDGQNIYISPTVKVGEKIESSIKTKSGLMQDVVLEVAFIPAQTVFINAKSQYASSHSLPEADKMLKDMISGFKDNKYHIRAVNRPLPTYLNALSIRFNQTESEKYDKCVGAVKDVHNDSKSMFELKEVDIMSLFKRLKYGNFQIALFQTEPQENSTL